MTHPELPEWATLYTDEAIIALLPSFQRPNGSFWGEYDYDPHTRVAIHLLATLRAAEAEKQAIKDAYNSAVESGFAREEALKAERDRLIEENRKLKLCQS